MTYCFLFCNGANLQKYLTVSGTHFENQSKVLTKKLASTKFFLGLLSCINMFCRFLLSLSHQS